MATKQGGGGGGRGSALSLCLCLSLCLSADSSLSCSAEQRNNIGYRYISEVAHTYACTHMHTHTRTHTHTHARMHARQIHALLEMGGQSETKENDRSVRRREENGFQLNHQLNVFTAGLTRF